MGNVRYKTKNSTNLILTIFFDQFNIAREFLVNIDESECSVFKY